MKTRTVSFVTVGDVMDYLAQFERGQEVILDEGAAGEPWHDSVNDLVVLDEMMEQLADTGSGRATEEVD
jgi:hypothetical protein